MRWLQSPEDFFFIPITVEKYQRSYLITIVVIFLIVFPVMFFTSGGYRGGMPACLIHLVIHIAPSAVILQTGKSIAA